MSPPPPLSADLARQVGLVVLDVDGVLTDGGVYVGTTPEGAVLELKRFDIRDGLGVKMLAWSGIEVAMVSGRVSEATTARARELGVEEVHQDPNGEKLPLVDRLVQEREIAWSQVAVLGDDLADLPILRHAGLPAAVANAVPEVVEACRWQGRRRGGDGAVREFARALLEARGEWADRVREYCRARSSL